MYWGDWWLARFILGNTGHHFLTRARLSARGCSGALSISSGIISTVGMGKCFVRKALPFSAPNQEDVGMRDLSGAEVEQVGGAITNGEGAGIGLGLVGIGIGIAAGPVGWFGIGAAYVCSYVGGVMIGSSIRYAMR